MENNSISESLSKDSLNMFLEYMLFFEHSKYLKEDGLIKRFSSPSYSRDAIRKKLSHVFLMRLRTIIGKNLLLEAEDLPFDVVVNFDKISRNLSRAYSRSVSSIDIVSYLRVNAKSSLKKIIDHREYVVGENFLVITNQEEKYKFLSLFFNGYRKEFIDSFNQEYEVILFKPSLSDIALEKLHSSLQHNSISRLMHRNFGLNIFKTNYINTSYFYDRSSSSINSVINIPLYILKKFRMETDSFKNLDVSEILDRDNRTNSIAEGANFSPIGNIYSGSVGANSDNFLIKYRMTELGSSAFYFNRPNCGKSQYEREYEVAYPENRFTYIMFSRKMKDENDNFYINPFVSDLDLSLSFSLEEEYITKGDSLKRLVDNMINFEINEAQENAA